MGAGRGDAHLYSAAHPSQKNKDFVAAYKKAFNQRPGFMAVGQASTGPKGYEERGEIDGDARRSSPRMKGMAVVESPRADLIDPETRDIVQNIYIREVKKVDGEPTTWSSQPSKRSRISARPKK